ncbi:MAG: dTDP-4-dehydrorhamnose reductase [Planctomycetes bacterium]|nr:dTDP-4-dehydrorhamnose reductase [Planctomycetota bacterium]
MIRILLTGARGQLAQDVAAVFQAKARAEVHPRTHEELDVTDGAAVRQALVETRATHLVNTAAFHKVDLCEDEGASAFRVNALGAQTLALACRDSDAVLVHFSTDYVFGRTTDGPFTEESRPGPVNLYGASKLAGEYLISQNWAKHFVLRACGLYGRAGASGKGGNFVQTMLRLARDGKPIRVVDDQVLTPTSTREVARLLPELLRADAYGLYHFTAEGQCSWYEFARAIFNLAGLRPEISPVASTEFPTRARRPAYSVLENAGLKRLGICRFRHWRECLAEYLRGGSPVGESKGA